MVQKTSVIAMVVGLLVASSFVGAAAFTSATVERDANIQVVTDDAGVIGLNPGGSSMVTLTDGELAIDASTSNANGVNTDALVEVGNPSDPANTYAFSVTNNDGSTRDLTLGYALTDSTQDSDTNDNLRFAVYDSSGSQVGSFAEGGSTTISNAGAGATYYVVLTIDTGQGTNGDDLSGTLTVSA